MGGVILKDLRYPIGPFVPDRSISPERIQACVDLIARLPEKLEQSVSGLSDSQLDTPYRPGGWTLRQVVHHLADSHVNSYVRFRLALTEENPEIKTYEEALWAELPDARSEAVAVSLDLLKALHRRWVILLRSISDEDWNRTFRHPVLGELTLAVNAQLYAWHGEHHLAHITSTAT